MYGVIVTPPLNEAEIMYAVYVDQKMPLLFIKRIPMPDRRKLSKQERKELDKAEKERSLAFGDWIEFEDEDIKDGCVERYRKIYPLGGTRSSGDHLQIETICIFPTSTRGWENECFSELFGRVRVDPEVRNCYLADVAYRCWVSVEVTRISSLSVELGDYIDVADGQDLVPNAPTFGGMRDRILFGLALDTFQPWNRRDPRFVTAIDSDSDDSDSESDDGAANQTYPHEVYDVQGVLVTERTVYSNEYPDVKIVLAYVRRDRRAPIGSCIQFNAYYSIPLQSYVVRSYRQVEKKPFETKPFEFGSVFLLEVSVKWGPELPMGHLWSKDKDLGLIHDPDGLLLPALLGKNPYSPLRVYVADTGVSRLSRFGIKDLSDMATNKANAVMNSGYAEISDDGLILGGNSVLAPRYLCLKIRFDSGSSGGWDKLSPGTWIKFTAWSPAGMPDFRVKTWNSTCSPLLVPVHAVPTHNGYAARGCFNQELSAIKSTVFGFIEIPCGKRSLMNPKGSGVTTIWVREDKGNAKSRFILHSTEAPEPVDVRKIMERNAVQSSMNSIKQRHTAQKVIVPCKSVECEGKQLLQRCFNNRAVVNSLIQASANELLTSIVKLLTIEKSEI